MKNTDRYLNAIRNTLKKHSGVEPSTVALESRLQADLGLDSIGLLSLALELENEFQVYLAEDANNPPETVADIVALLLTENSELKNAS